MEIKYSRITVSYNIKKEQVITELHNRWNDSDSEVVKRMNSFSEKSPEILKPILEGSK